MAFDAFLKIDGVNGESKDSVHQNEIDVMSYTWGGSQPTGSTYGGGGGVGKFNAQDLTITKRMDIASPNLFQNCASGKPFDSAVLTIRKAGGGSPVEYLKYTMTNVIVTSFQNSGMAGGTEDVPTEHVSLSFSAITVDYTQQDETGTASGNASAGWDLKANKAAA